ncbi:hypothetical protein IKP85_03500 [bacterium]|nr:hypothetical protein [bacterium]
MTNLIALDTRNNNDVLYWASENDPTYNNGDRNQPDSIREAQTTLSDGSKVYTWLNYGTAGYNDENQLSAKNNRLPVLNLSVIQKDGLTKEGTKQVPDTDAEPIGYQKKPVYIEVPEKEYQLVEDPNFSINSLALEEGLRSGAYTLVQQSETSTTKTITLNGLFFNTIDLSSCSMITDETDQEAVNRAEAEYNKEMAEIQIKDKRYEMDQKKIDTQYQAYLAEEESIKSVLSKNVERSFKTFG